MPATKVRSAPLSMCLAGGQPTPHTFFIAASFAFTSATAS
ncbi:hypothetical protein L842_5453 [Mycobacterium intracellulare MIN_052511_1280]|nr:hypothetical protein L842_5453 [Mycobacterium intracellulare MIN_052511_1280]